jgi:acyl-CoA synthetase (NDP forming)
MTRTIQEQMDPIFRPRSVAIVGASNNPDRWGYHTTDSILNWSQFRGEIYPINPKDEFVYGLKAYKSVMDVPGPIDLAVIVVNASQVLDVFRQCAEKKVGGAVIITAGFAEVGPEGARLQAELVDLSRESGIRFVGPNCNGLWTSAARLNLTFWNLVTPGPTAFISQSGTMGDYLFEVSQAKGYGFSKIVSSGNQASLDVCDYLEYLADDEDTRTVALYLEGVKDGRRFLEAARKATAEKPVLVYKVGRTVEGARAATTHTASLTGSARKRPALRRRVPPGRRADLRPHAGDVRLRRCARPPAPPAREPRRHRFGRGRFLRGDCGGLREGGPRSSGSRRECATGGA